MVKNSEKYAVTVIGLMLYTVVSACVLETSKEVWRFILVFVGIVLMWMVLDELDSKRIKVKYHSDKAHVGYYSKGDLIDLRAAEDVTMKQGEFRLISLGVSMELPKGYMAKVYPRSSTFKNFGIILANSVGIIDESYCGDDDVWQFPAIAMRDTKIKAGDRIAQFEIVEKMPSVFTREVDTLGNENRGGIGSTGVV